MKTTKLNLFAKGLASFALILSFALVGCNSDPDMPNGDEITDTQQVFVLNSGGNGKANASLDVYFPASKKQAFGVFRAANNIGLGDTAQSIQVRGDGIWICVNSSQVIYHIDAKTHKILGQIKDISKPRHIYFVSDTKAYVSHFEDPNITIINPKTYQKIGTIETFMTKLPAGTPADNFSTEMFVEVPGGKVLVNCWSYQESVLLIDTATDKVEKTIKVGMQPNSMAMDKNGLVWVICGGMTWADPEMTPSIYTIDPKEDYKAAKFGDVPEIEGLLYQDVKNLVMNRDGESFLFSNNSHIYKMSITDKVIPSEPFIMIPRDHFAYTLAIAPNGEIYVGDAIDYRQEGTIIRYSADGKSRLDQFYTGVIPAGFAFYDSKM